MQDITGDIELTYDPAKDPILERLDEVIKCLGYVMIKNLGSWFKILQNQINTTDPFHTKDSSNGNLDAGVIYNSLLMSSPVASNITNVCELVNKEWELVVNSFHEAALENTRLRSTAVRYKDPEECMWELCHYFFIPVRVNVKSIPKNVRDNSLRKWVNIAFVTPFVPNYRMKYANVISRLDFIQTVHDAFITEPAKMESIMASDYRKIESCLGRRYSPKSQLHLFLRKSLNIMMFSCSEMIKAWCPCLAECVQINPQFNGEWCNRFDPMLITQLSMIDAAVGKTVNTDEGSTGSA